MATQDVWSIGIYTGSSPLHLGPRQHAKAPHPNPLPGGRGAVKLAPLRRRRRGERALRPCADAVAPRAKTPSADTVAEEGKEGARTAWRNPVLTAAQVTDVPATFVADPFMIQAHQTWYMFFEVLHAQWQRGVIGLATSRDGRHWQYARVVLQEPFHLSYPYVFQWQDDYYMVPETLEAEAIRIYRAVDFPTSWVCVDNVLAGQYADPSLFRADGKWWMLVCSTPFQHDTLCLYYADTLLGPWRAHAQNPLIQGDAHSARPGGRVTVLGKRIIRYAQDDAPFYGRQVRAFEITELTTTRYAEREVPESPVLKPSGAGWNAKGMHHIDPHRLDDTHWLASVDGHYEESTDD